jgi:hypothetical protein
MWPDRRLTELFEIEHPLVLAPMAGLGTVDLQLQYARPADQALSVARQCNHSSLRRQFMTCGG